MDKLKLLILSIALYSSASHAGYTANAPGIVKWVKIYNNDTIFFGISNMPTDHKCSENYFVIHPSISENQRAKFYSMLLAARASSSQITVGYDNQVATCSSGRPVVQAISF